MTATNDQPQPETDAQSGAVRHVKRFHFPRVYRYRVADPARWVRFMWNRYESEGQGRATIGAAVLIGTHAYCIKWARAEVSR